MGAPPVAYDGLVSGAALVLSGLFPWVRSGAGSSYRGMELAASLRSGVGLPDWAPRAALGIIALALVGVAHLVSSVSRSPTARRFRLVSGVMVIAGLVWLSLGFSVGEWGAGLLLAAVGAAAATAAGLTGEIQAISARTVTVERPTRAAGSRRGR